MKKRILLENTAAISAELHLSRYYPRFYKRHADSFGGFSGIWNFCIDAAEVFSKAEIKFEKFEWLDAITEYADELIHAKSLLKTDLERLALAAIKAHRY